MARGRDEFYGRREDVARLGRRLSRRARNACELCGTGGSLTVVEVPPLLEQPALERAIMVCARCGSAVTDTRRLPAADELRFLAESVWSDVLPVQLAAVRLARRPRIAGPPRAPGEDGDGRRCAPGNKCSAGRRQGKGAG